MAELLAPAGSLSQVWTAIDAGADAVYLGGKAFNARKFAHNLSDEELEKAVRTAHAFGVRIYVTVNILIADKEVKELAAYLRRLDTMQVDGIIVQDMAVAVLARQVAPNLPLHGSTQMAVADLAGVKFLESLGFTQAVLAREVPLDEIRSICAHTSMAIEVFIHGASCMSYSGQCLMSSFIGGRSGNRGACAQPCRLPYTLLKDGKALTKGEQYLLSLKDLNSLEYIHALLDAGVSSFKIEGRMKGTGYVHTVVEAYRRMIDSCSRSPQEQQKALRQSQEETAESFNRTYQHDFLTGTIGRTTITQKNSGNQGHHVGKATAVQGTHVDVIVNESLTAGDMIKIISPDGQEFVDEIQDAIGSFTNKSQFTLQLRRQDACVGTLYRLSRKEDRPNSHNNLTRRIPIYGHVDVNEQNILRLTVWDENGHTAEVVSDYIVQLAKRRPADQTWVYEQLNRLGDTIFTLADVTLWADGYMIPASVLNTLRRQAVDRLMDMIEKEYVRPQAGRDTYVSPDETLFSPLDDRGVVVRCDTLEGVAAAARGGAYRVIFGGESYTHRPFSLNQWEEAVEIAEEHEVELWAATPRIITEKNVQAVRQELKTAIQCGAVGIYAGAMSVFTLCKELGLDVPIYADWSLNIFNSLAAQEYVRLGCQGITVSTEASLRQIQKIAANSTVPLEAVVQGKLEMMITEYCSMAAFDGKGCKKMCPAPCVHHTFALQDRRDEQFPIVTDQYCRNHILNSKDLDMVPYFHELQRAGIRWLRIEGRGRSTAWIEQMTAQYRRLCDGLETMLFGKEDQTVTRGHFLRGIL